MADNIEEQSKQNTNDAQETPPTIARVRKENTTLDWDGIRSEKLLQLKKSRSSKKGIVTKAQNEIKDMMLNSNNAELVKGRIKEFKQLVQDLRIPIPLIIPIFATNTKLKNQMSTMML